MKRRDLAYARQTGWTVQPTRGGHLKLQHPSGAFVFCAGTPGDRRAEANAIAMIRRVTRQPKENRR